MLNKIFLFGTVLCLSGCAIDNAIGKYAIDNAIGKYEKVANQVNLGDTRDKVFGILMPTQGGLSAGKRKQPDKYMKDSKKIEIYYFRTQRQPDGLTTDDEFTPYIFEDGILQAIGWATIGGPKTSGQVVPKTNINVRQQTTVK